MPDETLTAEIVSGLLVCSTKQLERIKKIVIRAQVKKQQAEQKTADRQSKKDKRAENSPRRSKRGRPALLTPNPRAEEMRRLTDEGKSFQDIATIYGVSRERVRQIMGKWYSLTGKNYERTNAVLANKIEQRMAINKERAYEVDVRYTKLFGCSKDRFVSLCGREFITWNKKYRSGYEWMYFDQKRSARYRKIPWELTLPEWIRIWEDSGKLNMRGHHADEYVMARWGDVGPYSVDNVYICTASKNGKDRIYGKHARKSHCIRRHELSEDNVYIHKKTGSRRCKACQKIRERSRNKTSKTAA